MKKTALKSLLGIVLLVVALLPAGCGGGGGGSSKGTLQVALTDNANPEFSKVVVAVEEIRVVPPGAAQDSTTGKLPVVASFDKPLSINVLDLKYQQQLLGKNLVPAGDYHQLRLVVSPNTDPTNPANYVVLASDPTETRIPLTLPSGQESGLKLVGHFSVTEGQSTAVVLDFDPGKAVVEAGGSGNWNFKPTGIRVVRVKDTQDTYGSLSGLVAQESTDANGQQVQTPVAGALVSVTDQEGIAVASTLVNPDDGSFRVFLPSGSYQIHVTANDFDTFDSPADSPYPVEVGQDTDAGTIDLGPIPR